MSKVYVDGFCNYKFCTREVSDSECISTNSAKDELGIDTTGPRTRRIVEDGDAPFGIPLPPYPPAEEYQRLVAPLSNLDLKYFTWFLGCGYTVPLDLSDGAQMSSEALQQIANGDFMTGVSLQSTHSPLGKLGTIVTHWYDKTNKALWITGLIYKGTDAQKEVAQQILNGQIKGLSAGFLDITLGKGPERVNKLIEMSVVDNPNRKDCAIIEVHTDDLNRFTEIQTVSTDRPTSSMIPIEQLPYLNHMNNPNGAKSRDSSPASTSSDEGTNTDEVVAVVKESQRDLIEPTQETPYDKVGDVNKLHGEKETAVGTMEISKDSLVNEEIYKPAIELNPSSEKEEVSNHIAVEEKKGLKRVRMADQPLGGTNGNISLPVTTNTNTTASSSLPPSQQQQQSQSAGLPRTQPSTQIQPTASYSLDPIKNVMDRGAIEKEASRRAFEAQKDNLLNNIKGKPGSGGETPTEMYERRKNEAINRFATGDFSSTSAPPKKYEIGEIFSSALTQGLNEREKLVLLLSQVDDKQKPLIESMLAEKEQHVQDLENRRFETIKPQLEKMVEFIYHTKPFGEMSPEQARDFVQQNYAPSHKQQELMLMAAFMEKAEQSQQAKIDAEAEAAAKLAAAEAKEQEYLNEKKAREELQRKIDQMERDHSNYSMRSPAAANAMLNNTTSTNQFQTPTLSAPIGVNRWGNGRNMSFEEYFNYTTQPNNGGQRVQQNVQQQQQQPPVQQQQQQQQQQYQPPQYQQQQQPQYQQQQQQPPQYQQNQQQQQQQNQQQQGPSFDEVWKKFTPNPYFANADANQLPTFHQNIRGLAEEMQQLTHGAATFDACSKIALDMRAHEMESAGSSQATQKMHNYLSPNEIDQYRRLAYENHKNGKTLGTNGANPASGIPQWLYVNPIPALQGR